MPKQRKQLRRYGFILWENETRKLSDDNKETFIKALNKVCKRWIFQLEKGTESGKLHFQGRFSFDQPKGLKEVLKQFPDYPDISITIEHDEEGSSFYVMKERTRIAGPWSDKDKKEYITRQVREIEKLLPWQQQIADSANIWDKRTINLIFDIYGNIGKTTICQYLRAYKIGRKIPFCNDYKDIMRMVMDMPESRLYLIDLPRAINKDKLNQMYAAIETIKEGYAFDDRYSFKEKDFDCPNIWVFTNKLPDFNYLSLDRWILWTVDNNQLQRFNIDDIEECSDVEKLDFKS